MKKITIIVLIASICIITFALTRKETTIDSITIYCIDGTNYTTQLTADDPFKCNWKQLVFNY